MCMGSLPLTFTKSFATLQPTRPLGRVGSKLDWYSYGQCQRSNSKCFLLTLTNQIQRPNPLKTVSKINDFPRRLPWELIVLLRSFIHILTDVKICMKSRKFQEMIISVLLRCASKFETISHRTTVSETVAHNHLITALDVTSEPAILWLFKLF